MELSGQLHAPADLKQETAPGTLFPQSRSEGYEVGNISHPYLKSNLNFLVFQAIA
jgi:hypothetical protein